MKDGLCLTHSELRVVESTGALMIRPAGPFGEGLCPLDDVNQSHSDSLVPVNDIN